MVIDPTQQEFASIITAIMNEVVGPVAVQGEISYAIRTLLSEIPAYQQADAATQNAVAMQSFGVQMAQVQQLADDPWVSIESRTLQGEDVVILPDNMFALFVPGFVVMFAFFIVGAMGAELLQERQQGSLRRLMAAPIPRWTIIIAKMMAYIGLVLVQVLIIFGVASLFFQMPLGNSMLGLLLVSVVLGLTSTSLGVMVAALARTDKQADFDRHAAGLCPGCGGRVHGDWLTGAIVQPGWHGAAHLPPHPPRPRPDRLRQAAQRRRRRARRPAPGRHPAGLFGCVLRHRGVEVQV